MKASDIAALVTEGKALKARLKADTERLKEVSAALSELGAGEYLGADGAKALVVLPSPALKPDHDTVEGLRPALGKAFGKLFEAVTTYKPVKGFREVAGALLTPAKAAKVIAACEVESAAQVRFS